MDITIPCIYTLNTKKDKLTYSKIFHNIIKLDVDRQGVTMKPSHLTCGFEIASIEAFKSIFFRSTSGNIFQRKSRNVLFLHILLALIMI